MVRLKNLSSMMRPWGLAMQGTMLAIESQQVIAMRVMKMALGGPDVKREAELMVSEKMESAMRAGQMVVMAALDGAHDMGAGQVVRHYRKKVRANVKRLSG